MLTDFGLSKQFRISHRLHHSEHDDRCAGGETCIHIKTSTFCGTAEYLGASSHAESIVLTVTMMTMIVMVVMMMMIMTIIMTIIMPLTMIIIAPEVLREEPYSFEVDWWSLGTFLYEMLTGMTPFWAENQVVMYKRVLEDELEFPEELIGPDARDLIAGLLTRHPQRRLGYGADGARNVMLHPFFKEIHWDDLLHGRVIPPYIPRMRDDFDLSHFDEEFTRMTPRLSPPAAINCQVHHQHHHHQAAANGNTSTSANANLSASYNANGDDTDSMGGGSQCGDGNCSCAVVLSQDQFTGYSFVCGSSDDRWMPSAVNASFVTVSETTTNHHHHHQNHNRSDGMDIRVNTSTWMSRYQIKRRRSSVVTPNGGVGSLLSSFTGGGGGSGGGASNRNRKQRKDDEESILEFEMEDV